MLSKIKKHYHWVIAAVILIEMAVIGGSANNYNSLFLLNITEELGIPRAGYALAYSTKSMFTFISTLLSAYLFLRMGNRIPYVAGLVLCSTGYILLSLSNDVVMLSVSNAVLGIGEAFCCTAAASRVIGDWFHKHKGTVWGFVSASTGIGGSLVCILLSNIIETGGWRSGYIACSVAAITMAGIVCLLLRSKPASIGLNPYGMGQIVKVKRAVEHFSGPGMDELRRKPAFYLGLVVAFLGSFSVYLVFNNVVPHLRDQGLSQAEAVVQQSTMLIYLTVFKILVGLLSDRIGARTTSVISVIFIVISMLLLTTVNSVFTATIALIAFSIALPFVTVLLPLLTYQLFGYRSHGASLAIFMSMPTFGALMASPVANAVHDAVGSYSPIMLISAGIGCLTLVLLLTLFALAKRIEQNYEHEKM